MSKRKITERQKARLKSKQDKHLKNASSDHSKAINSNDKLENQLPGIILTNLGKNAYIEDNLGKVYLCEKRQNLGSLVTGDKISWEYISEGKGVITAIYPRESLLERPDSRGNMKPVAANIDQVIIVIAPTPKPHFTTIDRYLVVSELSNIDTVVLLNKEDLLPESENKDYILDLIKQYEKLNYQTLIISSTEPSNEDKLKLENLLKDKTSVLVGQSGVGKSSLAKLLLPNTDIKIGKISDKSKRGKQTTTSSYLYRLPNNANIIDSPGIQQFPLEDLPASQLVNGFIELKPLVNDCKFRNCKHTEQELGCAINEALQKGSINENRIKSFRMLTTKEGKD